MTTYVYSTRGRNPRTLVVLAAFYAALLAGWIWLDAAVWIIAGLVAFSVPAIWDVASDRVSELSIDSRQLSWRSGRLQRALPLSELKHVRLDTRLDLSVRVTLVRLDDKKIRLPYDCLPPHQKLEDELRARGVPVQRHNFSLL